MPKLSVIFHARAHFFILSLFFSAPFLCRSITSYYTPKSDVWHFLLASMLTIHSECHIFFSSLSPFTSSTLRNSPPLLVCVYVFVKPHFTLYYCLRLIKFSQLQDDLLNISQLESFKEPLESINALFCTEAQVWYFYQNVLIHHKYFRNLVCGFFYCCPK